MILVEAVKECLKQKQVMQKVGCNDIIATENLKLM